jgi:hypothetical protein
MCAPLRVLPVPVLSQRIGQARLGRFVDLGGVVSLVCVCVCVCVCVLELRDGEVEVEVECGTADLEMLKKRTERRWNCVAPRCCCLPPAGTVHT